MPKPHWTETNQFQDFVRADNVWFEEVNSQIDRRAALGATGGMTEEDDRAISAAVRSRVGDDVFLMHRDIQYADKKRLRRREANAERVKPARRS